MLKDEIAVVKSVMMSLDTDTTLLVTYQYHVELDPTDPAGKKKDRSKSKYRYLARVFKTEDLRKKIIELRDDKNRLNKFRWPDDKWPWYICAKYSDNSTVSDWLMTKFRKIKSWEDGQKILAGWQNGTKTRIAGFCLSSRSRCAAQACRQESDEGCQQKSLRQPSIFSTEVF